MARRLLRWSDAEWAAWSACPPISEPLVVRKSVLFVAKAPLSSLYETQYAAGRAFGVDEFMNEMVACAMDLGLVIDATMDGCYYHDASEWEGWDVPCVKLAPEPGGGVPSEAAVRACLNAVALHWNKAPNRSVAIFSADGHSRAGYLALSFLVRRAKMPAPAALATFAAVRAPGLYHAPFVRALGGAAADVAERPEWGSSVELAAPALAPAPAPAPAPAERPAKRPRPVPGLPDDLPGAQRLDGDERARVLARLRELLGGARPELAASEPLRAAAQLAEQPLFVSWRPLGVRGFLVLLGGDGVFFVDASQRVTRVALRFPRRRAPAEQVDGTVLDGVLVEDGPGVRRLLVSDVLAFEGQRVGAQPLPRRLHVAGASVIDPRKAAGVVGEESFRVRLKPHYELRHTSRLLGGFAAQLTHKSDGIVFVPRDGAYSARRLKWRPGGTLSEAELLAAVGSSGASRGSGSGAGSGSGSGSGAGAAAGADAKQS